MKVIATGLADCLLFEPRVFSDDRGEFFEAFNHDRLREHGLQPAFVQGNVSRSRRGVLRGLHYQWPQPQGKLVTVLEGEAFDVAVDLRRDSPDFGRWTAVVLSGRNRRQFWIPEGHAHGFVALSEDVLFGYLCTATYLPTADAGVRWDDATLAIDWPVSAPLLSAKDSTLPFLADIPAVRLPAVA
ncbi:dTDP-4-dehydrorhamnose 3,5-epimerase [Arenimonas composti]|uniref:dTDP-4-dehydrorhamnose 3,5-epimerase n=1 Tax=Arenimonas composti TR7-09 = DSM 18010 TaxID=1121013 RepID=A0A091BEE0_9GAMM|nr:dTDP-4-dehydrorhamnose 3,5-epimerase [Arenimonas composti]KFN51033.1 hypothetical protein P873_04615 [Arenimonas composti TR7-09 = DSM 18010]